MHTYTQYIFDCPIHGYERQVLCWRAYNDDFLDRWLKMEVTESTVEWWPGELDGYISGLRKRIRESSQELATVINGNETKVRRLL